MSLPLPSPFFANPDPSLNFSTIQSLVTLLNLLAASAIDDTNFVPYIKGSSVPAVDDQDKAWIRLGIDGQPLGTYVFFNGLWVREYPSQGARIGFYSGPSNAFDSTGLGLAGPGPISADLFGWALANGQNLTADLSNQFIICAEMGDVSVGYSSGLWHTTIEGSALNQGGVSTITSDADNTYRLDRPQIKFDHHKADGEARSAPDPLWGDTGGGDGIVLQTADAGNTTPDTISIVNPYFALAIITFVGYAP